VALLALMALSASSFCPRHERLDDNFLLSARSRLVRRTSMISELRTCGTGGSSPRNHARSLGNVILAGNVVVVGNWTCKDECLPRHEELAAIPGLEKLNKCTESRQVGSMELQDDIDLKCLGSNLTCDDIENNATWRDWRETLYSNCNQDEELLHAECKLECRFSIHPTKRCTYKFDRFNKYKMHGHEGMFGFHHCVLLKYCEPNTTTEDNTLYCNITDTHKQIFSSTDAATSWSTSARTSRLPTATSTSKGPVLVQVAEDSGSSGLVLGAIIGGGVASFAGIFSAILYFKVCKKQTNPAANGAFSGVVREPDPTEPGSICVMGRPVAGVAPSAGQTANPTAGAQKGAKEVEGDV